jgi:hypothetical protein
VVELKLVLYPDPEILLANLADEDGATIPLYPILHHQHTSLDVALPPPSPLPADLQPVVDVNTPPLALFPVPVHHPTEMDLQTADTATPARQPLLLNTDLPETETASRHLHPDVVDTRDPSPHYPAGSLPDAPQGDENYLHQSPLTAPVLTPAPDLDLDLRLAGAGTHHPRTRGRQLLLRVVEQGELMAPKLADTTGDAILVPRGTGRGGDLLPPTQIQTKERERKLLGVARMIGRERQIIFSAIDSQVDAC